MPEAGVKGAGFPVLEKAKHVTIYLPTRESGGYNHHAKITRYNGRFYASWSSHPYAEDAPGQRVLFAWSENGADWTAYGELFPPPQPSAQLGKPGAFLAAGWWVEIEGRLFATAAFRDTYAFKGRDKIKRNPVRDDYFKWPVSRAHSALAREVKSDDTLGPVFFSGDDLPSNPESLPYRFAGIDEESSQLFRKHRSNLCMSMLNKPLGVDAPPVSLPPPAEKGHVLCEPVVYRRSDGEFVLLLRDDSYSHRMFVSTFDLTAKRWTTAFPTDIPDSPSLTTTVTLEEGAILLIGNQMAPKLDNPDEVSHYSRDPLTVSVSNDGKSFTRVFALRCGAQEFRITDVFGRGGGGQYPSALVHEGTLYVLYSMGKEDIAVSSVSLSDLLALHR